jgi:hypothetical protein
VSWSTRGERTDNTTRSGVPAVTLELSPAHTDFRAALVRTGVESPAGLTSADLASDWCATAESALTTGRTAAIWVGAGTLVGAAPGAIGAAELEEDCSARARERGAERRADIRPADRGVGRFTHYRRWFPRAALVDDESVVLFSRFNSSLIAAAAVRSLPSAVHERCRYEPETEELTVGRAPRSVTIPVDVAAFMALMQGVAPEAATMLLCSQALTTVNRMRDLDAAAAKGMEPAGFVDGAPAWRVGAELLVDPVGQEYLTTGALPADYTDTMREVVASDPVAPLCTARDEWWVRGILRPRAEMFSFEAAVGGHAPMVEQVGSRHVLIYQSTCSHIARQPRAADWTAWGWSVPDADNAWRSGPWPNEVLRWRKRGVLGQAALVHADEISALAARTELISGLCRRLGFAAGSHVLVFAPFANILFVSDEFHIDADVVASSVVQDGGLIDRLEFSRSVSRGGMVDYRREVVVRDLPPAPCELVAVEG